MRRAVVAACAVAALSATPVVAQEVKLLQKFNDWAAYVSQGSPKVCFAVSQPRKSLPRNVRRGPIYLYVAEYPSDKIAGEVSVKMGYPFPPGGKVTVTIGKESFELFTKDEGAFIEKPEDEAKIVAALKAGSTMTVKGRSARGTNTTDEYSLSGTSGALEHAAKECAAEAG